MSLRKIGSWSFGKQEDGSFAVVAVVYRDSEWQEYRVKLIARGVHQKDSDYHTDDRDDAMMTAKSMARAYSEWMTTYS